MAVRKKIAAVDQTDTHALHYGFVPASDCHHVLIEPASHPRIFRLQAVVLSVGDRCGEEGQHPQGSAPGNGKSEQEDATNCPYPLLTADGVWLADVGAEGGATYIPRVSGPCGGDQS